MGLNLSSVTHATQALWSWRPDKQLLPLGRQVFSAWGLGWARALFWAALIPGHAAGFGLSCRACSRDAVPIQGSFLKVIPQSPPISDEVTQML